MKLWERIIENRIREIVELSYRGIKLMTHTMKLWERIIENRIREIVELRNIQFGFRRGMSTTEPIFALRILQEKYQETKKDIYIWYLFI